jgi:hypothetical protein
MTRYKLFAAITAQALSTFQFDRVPADEPVDVHWDGIPVRMKVGALGPNDDAPMTVELWPDEPKPVIVWTWVWPRPAGGFAACDLLGGGFSLPGERRARLLTLWPE